MRSISLPTTSKTIGSYLFSGSIFRATLRRKWAECLLYAIFVTLVFPVLILFIASNSEIYLGRPTEEAAQELLDVLSIGLLGTNSIVALLWGAGSGVLSALLSASYLFNKKQAGFVCALPIKRSAYAISSAAASLCSAVASWLPACLLLFIGTFCTTILRINFGAIMLGFFGAFFLYLSVYILFFGLTSMAAALCGTVPMTVLMTFFISFYPWALYGMMVTTMETFLDNITTAYYYSTDITSHLSGAIRVFSRLGDKVSASYLLSTAALGLLYFAVFVLLCVKRKNEETGQHFVWAFAREGVKYLSMILCGIIGGLLFHALSSSGFQFGWMLIGICLGVVIAWMLCNLVFFKTSTMLFYAKRGMAILLVSVLLFMGFASVDLFALDEYIPSPAMTASITFKSEVGELKIQNKNLIRMYLAMIENGVAVSKDTVLLSPDSFGMISSLDGPISIVTPAVTSSSASRFVTTPINSVFMPKFMIPFARADMVLVNDYRTFLLAYGSSQDFVDRYMEPLYRFIDEGITDGYVVLHFNEVIYDNVTHYEVLTANQLSEFAAIYEEEVRAMGDSPMQNQIMGSLYISEADLNYPLFTRCPKSIAYLEEAAGFSAPEIPNLKKLKKQTHSVRLMRGDGIVKSLSVEEFYQYLKNGDISCQWDKTGKYYTDHLTVYDTTYHLMVSFGSGSYKTRDFYFLEGRLPEEFRK